MGRYLIELQETVSYETWIDADSEEGAADKAREMVLDGDFYDIDETKDASYSLGLEFVQVISGSDEIEHTGKHEMDAELEETTNA